MDQAVRLARILSISERRQGANEGFLAMEDRRCRRYYPMRRGLNNLNMVSEPYHIMWFLGASSPAVRCSTLYVVPAYRAFSRITERVVPENHRLNTTYCTSA